VSGSPFDALGLPTRPDLSDEQVRAAWRKIAAATHPDRTDGGDLARYTAATAAYVTLRAPWGRSEAYADVLAAADDTAVLPTVMVAEPWPAGVTGVAEPWPAGVAGPGPTGVARLGRLLTGWWQLPARIVRGRPLRLLIRAVAAVVLCLTVLALIPGQPAAPPLVAALITWFVLTGRSDLAPPRQR
jgi:hypothetical protein